MIWNCWKRAPLLKCSDTVCLSIIKTSKRSGTSETCTTCMSLRGLTFHDPGPRWNHQSSTYLSSTLALNFPRYYPIVCISATFSNIHVVYELTEAPMSWATLLPSQLKLTKVTRGRLSLIRIEYHKEQICRCGRCASLLWVISMVPRVPTAGLCPKILFRIVTRSLACFSRALGCCVRRLKTPAIPAFIFPCPKLLYAWDSFWHFPFATHCTACTQDHWSCNPPQAAPQKDLQGSMRNMQGTMRICWLFGLPSKQKLCTNQPYVPCPCSNLSESRDPFSSKTLSVKVKSQGTNGKKSHLLHLLLHLHELSRWPQHYENDVTAWSFQTLAFAMIGNCWKRAPLLKCSDIVCLSIIKTSKRSGTSETFACHCAGWHSTTLVLDETTNHLLICPAHLPWISLNTTQSCTFPLHSATSTQSTSPLKHLCLERHSCHHSSN